MKEALFAAEPVVASDESIENGFSRKKYNSTKFVMTRERKGGEGPVLLLHACVARARVRLLLRMFFGKLFPLFFGVKTFDTDSRDSDCSMLFHIISCR